MCNVPPKFNQICRLCLTLVEPKGANDDIVKKLSIFNNVAKNKNDKKGSQINDDVRDDDQLNVHKKTKRSNEISISLSGGSASVINNGFSSNDTDDESELDISKRILQCLSINVSHLFLHFSYTTLTWLCEMRNGAHGKGCCGLGRSSKDRSTSAIHFLGDCHKEATMNRGYRLESVIMNR